MNETTRIEIPVDARRQEAVGRVVDRMVRPGRANDPQVALLEAASRRVREAGLTEEDIDAELAAYNAERR